MIETKYCPLKDASCSARCAWYDEICGYCEIGKIAVRLDEIASILGCMDEALRAARKQEGGSHE